MFFPFYDSTYILVLIGVIVSMMASAKLNATYQRYSAVRSMCGLTGAEAAKRLLNSQGIYDVTIRRVPGSLTDHYDPRDNTIYLSESVYGAPTIAAVGVAAHEAGHAVQYALGYGPVRLRTAILPLTQIGSKFSFLLLFAGMLLYSQAMFLAGIILFSLTTFFQLVTLPVEFNASHRALETLESQSLLWDDELVGARRVLRAAAMTYVAALLMSALQLLRFVLIFAGRNNREQGGGRQ